MDGFVLAPRGWGLYVAVRRALSAAERDEFTDVCLRACWFLRGCSGWNIVADLSGLPLPPVVHEHLTEPLHLARQHGAGRFAALVRDAADAVVLTDALYAAGMDAGARVLTSFPSGPAALRRAHDWAVRGLDPLQERRAA